jgi:hypothetical protein
MRREMEFPTEWAIPSVMEQEMASGQKRPDSRAGDNGDTPAEEAVKFAPDNFLRGTYA